MERKNGNPPHLLSELAGIPGARSETQQSVRFEVGSIDEVIHSINRLQGTGALTIHFHSGRPNGLAEWKTFLRDRADS